MTVRRFTYKLSHSLEEELQEFQVEIQVLIHVEPYREVCYLKK